MSIEIKIFSLLIFSVYVWLATASRFRIPYPRFAEQPVTGIPGEPVFVTPYIEAGKISEGQNACSVPPLLGRTVSHAGFITVNATYNSNMFFWFFRSESNRTDGDPVLLWLQGGPGVTSLYGLFEENGPYYVDENGLHRRTYSWTNDFNVLYLDNPVGTGFSFTQHEGGYARTQEDVARDLYSALTQFFQLFPDLRRNNFVITGESYAGKYIPSIAYRIHKENPHAPTKINLVGIMIGNGYTDPENMFVYGEYLYQLGFVDARVKKEIQKHEESARVAIRAGRHYTAEYHDDSIFDIIRSAGIRDVYDFSNTGPEAPSFMPEFVQSERVRRAIHVGHFVFSDYEQVYRRMRFDMYKSVAHLLPELLENYLVIFYSGQFDIIVPHRATTSFLAELSWSRAAKYYEHKYDPLYVDDQVAGYIKNARSYLGGTTLLQILVRNAGHMVPANQPKWMYYILKLCILDFESFDEGDRIKSSNISRTGVVAAI